MLFFADINEKETQRGKGNGKENGRKCEIKIVRGSSEMMRMNEREKKRKCVRMSERNREISKRERAIEITMRKKTNKNG